MKIVIIGGVAAGAKAAAKSRRLLPDAEIDIYTQENFVSYSACGMPYFIEGSFEDWKRLIVRSAEEFEKNNIHIHTRHRVTKILPADKNILVNDLENDEFHFINYDKLVIATGTVPNLTGFPNTEFKNIFTLKTLEDAVAIKDYLQKANHITVIGGGYINIELLEAFVRNGKRVDMIERAPFIMPSFDEEISAIIQNYILENSNSQVKIHTDDTVNEFLGDDFVRGISTIHGSGFETDMVVIAAGIRPVVDIAHEAGIELGITGAIKVNSRMETNLPDIYACGDCAEKVHIVSNTPVWIPLGSTANKEGRIAAINLCGGSEDFEGVLGSAVTRYFDLNISLTGLN